MKKIIALLPEETIFLPENFDKTAEVLCLTAAKHLFDREETILNKAAHETYLSQVQNWIQHLIFSESTNPESRAKIIVGLIQIAKISQTKYPHLGIGYTLMKTLDSDPIQNLTLTWCHVPQKQYETFRNVLHESTRQRRNDQQTNHHVDEESLALAISPEFRIILENLTQKIATLEGKISIDSKHVPFDDFLPSGPPRQSLLDECLIPVESTYKEHLNTLKKRLDYEYHTLFKTADRKIEAIKNDSLTLQIEAAEPTIAPGNFDERKSTPTLPENFIEVLLRNGRVYLEPTLDLSKIQLKVEDISTIAKFLEQEPALKTLILDSKKTVNLIRKILKKDSILKLKVSDSVET